MIDPVETGPGHARDRVAPERCAVIIVAYNCWPHLFRCLDALQKQSVTGFQTVIVDNGDAGPEQQARALSYPNTRYVKSESNLGFAAGNNRGLKLIGDSDWVMLLNPDTVPAPDCMENMLAAAGQDPAYSVFAARLIQAERPERLDGDGDCYHISGLPWRKDMGVPVTEALEGPREIFAACAAAALYRVAALRAVGDFDEDFFCYMEDIDLGFRLRLAGQRCRTVPDARVLHVGSATTQVGSTFYIYHGQRNLVWAFVKNMPGWLFWAFLPLHILLNVVGVLHYSLKGKSSVVWQAKRDALSALPRVWRKRREIQGKRAASVLEISRVLEKIPVRDFFRLMKMKWM